MNTLPSPVRPEPAEALDARIRAAEQRLVEREERLQDGATQLMLRVQGEVRRWTRPRRLLRPVLMAVGALAGLVMLGRALGHRATASSPGPSRPVAGRQGEWHGILAGLPWPALLGTVWPLLPPPWRTRVSPAGAASAIGLLLPLLQRMAGRGGTAHAPLPTMAQVDLARYAGTWHEIARLPQVFESGCAGQPTATYRPRGRGRLEVINRCETKHGPVEARGEARVTPGGGGAKLEVSLWPAWSRWLPMAWAKYWILHVDADYRVALVGHPNRRYLWVLSRTPTLPAAQLDALLALARERGFALGRLQVTPP